MRVGSGEIDAEAEAPPMREVFASSVHQIEIFPEHVRIDFCSDRGLVSVVLTPTAFNDLARTLAAGPQRTLH